MKLIVDNIKWIMLVAGGLTCTMIYAVIAPQAALESTFGESLSGPVANIVVRNWGALITIVGAMLIYAAFNPVHRKLVAVVAASSKLIWSSLVIILGGQYLSQAGPVIGFDIAVAFVLILFVLSAKEVE